MEALVAHSGPLQNDSALSAKLLHCPGCRRGDQQMNRQELFMTCDGDRAAEEMINMIREQFSLPAGSIIDNYITIGCLFARCRQSKSRWRQKSSPSVFAAPGTLP